MLKLVLPEYERVFGTEASRVFNKKEKKAPISDVAIAMGGYTTSIMWDNKERTGSYWLREVYSDKDAYVVSEKGYKTNLGFYACDVGCCPGLKFESIDEIINLVSGELEDLGEGVKKGKVYVPLYVEKENQDKLQQLLKEKKIKPLDQKIVTFPTNSTKQNMCYVYPKNCVTEGDIQMQGERIRSKPVERKDYSYYEYEGELYLLLEINSCYNDEYIYMKLLDGKYYKNGNDVFFKVVETDLYVDEENKEAYFDKILFAGIPFDHTAEPPEDFDKSDIRQYLDVYLQELEKLQQVVRKIKDKTQSDTKTNSEYSDSTRTNSAMNDNKLADYFSLLCKKSDLLGTQIEQLEEKLRKAKEQKKDIDKKIEEHRTKMDQEGMKDGR